MTSDIQTRMGYRVRTPRRLSGWHVGNDVGLPLEREAKDGRGFAPSDWGKKRGRGTRWIGMKIRRDLRLQASLRQMRRMCLVTDMYRIAKNGTLGEGVRARKTESVTDKTHVQKGEVRLLIKGRALRVNGTRTVVRPL